MLTRPTGAARRDGALSSGLSVATWSRLLVLVVAVASALLFGDFPHSVFAPYEGRFFGGWPLEGVLEALLEPLAHQDAQRYIDLAANGYGGAGAFPADERAGLFPLYSVLVRGAAGFSRDPGLLLIAAYAVSFAAFAGSLYVLHRLVELEVGRRHCLPALLLLALFPGALFFGVPFSESTFLLLSVGAFYAARLGRFSWAGVLAGAASATRPAGVLLILPLLLIYLYGPRADRAPDRDVAPAARWRSRYRRRRDIAWLALAPVGLALFTAYLALTTGDALAYSHALERGWGRELTFPLITLWDGVRAGFGDLGELSDFLTGSGGLREPHWWLDSVNLVVLALAAASLVGVFRRLPAAYGSYALVSLVLPLASPPLTGMLRYVAVLFPIFVWLALVCERPRRLQLVLAGFVVLLVFFTAQFATWRFVA